MTWHISRGNSKKLELLILQKSLSRIRSSSRTGRRPFCKLVRSMRSLIGKLLEVLIVNDNFRAVDSRYQRFSRKDFKFLLACHELGSYSHCTFKPLRIWSIINKLIKDGPQLYAGYCRSAFKDYI